MLNLRFIREVGFFQWGWRTAIRQFYKRVLKRDHTMRLPTGERMILPLGSRFASEAFVTGADVDWGSERLLDALIKGHGVFLDIGANIGYYSLYFSPRASAVYSFEPDPRVLPNLKRNAANNPKIEVVPAAVGAAQGVAHFVIDADVEVSHLSLSGEKSENQIEVEVTTIDAFVSTRNLTVEAIKIDAEGHDLEVIQGGLRTLIDQCPIILIETTPDAALFALTDEAGYRVFAYIRHTETRRLSFAELIPAAPPQGETKMLFLVPARLSDEIKAKAQIR